MKKTLRIIACVALIAVIVVGAFCAASFAGKDNTPNDKADAGLIITPGEVQGDMISLLTQGPGVDNMGLPISEYTLTVVLNEDCPNNMKAIDWSIAWKNPSSTWATGKVVTDYVTVTPTSDGALTAKVKRVAGQGLYAGGFGEQIIVTAASRVRPELKATATVDCLKSYRLVDGENNPTLTVSNVVLEFGKAVSFDVAVDDSKAIGTVSFKTHKGKSIMLDADSTTKLTNIIKNYITDYSHMAILTETKVGEVFNMDKIIKVDEETKSTMAYKQAYNAVLEYLSSSSVKVKFNSSSSYDEYATSGPSVTNEVTINTSSLTPFDLVTSLAFADNAIIF